MTDLLSTLPSFPTASYTHLLPSLEKSLVTTSDLLTLDALEIAKRAQLPILDIKRLATHITELLHRDLGLTPREDDLNTEELKGRGDGKDTSLSNLKRPGSNAVKRWNTISVLDDALDVAIGGGIPTGYITEITGER